MSCDLQYLDSTRIDSPELRSLPQQPLNDALIYVAQEVSGLLQQSLPVNGDNNPVETIAIRAIEPEYKFIIAIEPLTDRELEVLQLIYDIGACQALATPRCEGGRAQLVGVLSSTPLPANKLYLNTARYKCRSA